LAKIQPVFQRPVVDTYVRRRFAVGIPGACLIGDVTADIVHYKGIRRNTPRVDTRLEVIVPVKIRVDEDLYDVFPENRSIVAMIGDGKAVRMVVVADESKK
jgi:hypothetical protein